MFRNIRRSNNIIKLAKASPNVKIFQSQSCLDSSSNFTEADKNALLNKMRFEQYIMNQER